MYRSLRPALFLLEPETAHWLAMRAASVVARSASARRLLARRARRDDPRLRVEAFGLSFPSPLGLAAGLDKDADALPFWSALGFGHVEIGTVTARAQPGNPRPRAVRLRADRAIVNAMGFPSIGADALASRLEAWRRLDAWPDVPVVVNVGKSRAVSLEHATDDYLTSIRTLLPYADAIAINVSSPNTPGLRDLQDEEPFEALLRAVREAAAGTPVLVKLAPDLSDRALGRLAALCEATKVDGIVATNTTVGRAGLKLDPGAPGGLSGPPLALRAMQVLRVLRRSTSLPIVSVGGIDGAAEAIRRLEAGADLLQVYTGLIYEGPSLPRRIADGIVAELDRRGLSHVGELRADPRDTV
ncbi:MAG: quinone-dependent dihydroorotate dehydrogenase [Trueperaceae bacterium]|nr:quinone-dependent dihydroorotate dehydrogenase [Trueperaceae bacterium]